MSKKEMVTNIFGDEIEACCYDPMTGYLEMVSATLTNTIMEAM